MQTFKALLFSVAGALACPVWAVDHIVVEIAPVIASSGPAIIEEPFVPPLTTVKLKIVSGFGKRTVPASLLPANPAPALASEIHEGIDYAVAPGTPVRAARAGKVLFAGFSKFYASRKDKKDQSRFIIVRHADGQTTRYVHLATLRVRPMQEVAAGDILGTAASSDEWTVPVVHFEIRNAAGTAVNPAPLLEPVKPVSPL